MITSSELLPLYRTMVLIRLVEDGIAKRYREDGQLMRCPVHLCTGQEATAAGVCAHLSPTDGLFGTHRAHGHFLAKGGEPLAMIAELYGKSSGCCQGRGGSMHLVSHEAGFLGATPIVGDTVPLAVGAAWAGQRKGDGSIAAVFFGDGCFEEGVLHESMNFAALKKIPVIFICENNNYSVYTPLKERQPDRPIRGIAEAHGLAVYQADGNDVEAVWEVMRQATHRVRAGEGPAFLELFTFRLLEHCGPDDDDGLGYRAAGELNDWKKRCPLQRTAARLRGLGVPQATIDEVHAELEQDVAAAFAQAKADSLPENTAGAGLFAAAPVWPATPPTTGKTRHITYSQAIREGIAQAMTQNPDLFIIGEGVPDPKAIFGTTQGLQEEFGPQRVLDMPLAENGLTGVCIGAALCGARSIMVHQRIDFLYLALDQLANVAAKWHYLFHRPVPLVVRTFIGRGWGQGPQHAQSLQALFGHIPGLKVVMPVTAQDAKGMMLAAVDDPNPVIFVEHRWLHTVTGNVPEEPYRISLAHARLVRSGKHVTVAAFSHMVVEALRAAETLEKYGVEVEVIDMRVVQPLDMKPVLKSVRKTGRLLVADTGWTTCGMGAEIVAQVVEKAYSKLKRAPVRIGLPDYPTPTAPSLVHDYYPDAETVAQQVISLLKRGAGLPVEEILSQLRWQGNRDVPNARFTGPF
ncbi:MAG: dehydrogenase [Magnetococcales bacterium]|nr:dehydrogenase [Magnetococcales bacterium]